MLFHLRKMAKALYAALFGYAHRPLIVGGIVGLSYGVALQCPGPGVFLTWLGSLALVTGCVCCVIWHAYHNEYPE